MKRSILLTLSLMLMASLLLAACAPAATETPTEPPAAQPTEPMEAPTEPPEAEEPTEAVEEPTEAAQEEPQDFVELSAGWVAAIDQVALPVAVEQGFFEEEGLEVNLAGPYPTGVDELNALQSGEIQFAQAGVPTIGAIVQGMDLVYLGNYTGSSAQAGIDETMAIVAAEGSEIVEGDPTSLQGKQVGAAVGSISHLYLLGVLENAGLTENDVEIINTSPPDMAVALQTGGVDAIAIWDPWPVVALNTVPGSFQVVRGGGFISFIGYIAAERSWVEENPDVVVRFLRARAKADQWMRENPQEAAEIAVRWLPGMQQEVAEEAMQYNIRQLDPRFSACNYLAVDTSQQLLADLGTLSGQIDPQNVFEPQYILQVMEENPELFADLAEIPEGAQIADGYTYDPQQAMDACQ